MNPLHSWYMLGGSSFVAGAFAGYWLWRWKNRSVRAALAIKEESILETARRQAEAISREARVQANEEALKLRDPTEQALTERRARISEAEQRMVEREALINRQLENMVQEEKSLRQKEQEYQAKFEALDQQQVAAKKLL